MVGRTQNLMFPLTEVGRIKVLMMKACLGLIFCLLFVATAYAEVDCSDYASKARFELERVFDAAAKNKGSSSTDSKDRIISIRERALAVYDKCSGNSEYIGVLTSTDLYSGNNEAALEHVDDGLRSNQEDISLMVIKSRVLDQLGRQEEGLSVLQGAFEISPGNHFVNYEMCGKLIEAKSYPDAIKVCTLAINTGTAQTLPWSYLNRGIAYKALGDISAAKKDRIASKQHGMKDWLLFSIDGQGE